MHDVFVGREVELAKLDAAMSTGIGARVAVVAVQGMAGVGKSYLVEQYCARHRARLGTICRWVMDPGHPATAAQGLLELARQAGLDVGRIQSQELALALDGRPVAIHIDNVDSEAAARVVADLLRALPTPPTIVTGRYTALGTTPGSGWQRVEVECLDQESAVALLREELRECPPSEPEARELATELGGLPLALHLAAGYLRSGYTAQEFLGELRAENLALPPVDAADPVATNRSRGIIAAAFGISKKLFLAEATKRGKPWEAALGALGWAPLVGFGRSLGAAIVGVPEDGVGSFLRSATALSLLRRAPGDGPATDRWSVHPLVAEFLRADHARGPVDARVAAWVAQHGDGEHENRGERWAALAGESAAVHEWLAEVDEPVLRAVLPSCWEFGISRGPAKPWLDAARRACHQLPAGRADVAWAWAQLANRMGLLGEVLQAAEILKQEGDGERDQALAAGLIADVFGACGETSEGLRIRLEQELPMYDRLGDVRSKAVTMEKIADVLMAYGDMDEGLRIREELLAVYERLGDMRSKAVAMEKISDVLVTRGDLDEALRIRREEALPVYERLGDVRSTATAMGKIADILVIRGDLEEGLRLLREEALLVYERLGDVRGKTATMGKIADILVARGELGEGLRIRCEEELPVYERLEDVRSKAVTMGKIADILVARGELGEGLRIRCEEELPVYERLEDVRSKAVTMGKIADILVARGESDAALRIRREEELPVYERLEDVRSKAVTMGKIADILAARGELDEALRIHREEALPVYERLGAVRDKAMTMGRVAQILVMRGELDEGIRIHLEEALPVYERMNAVRETAVTKREISHILAMQGKLDEALRTLREDTLPVFERLGDVRNKAVTMGKIADILVARGDLDEGLRIRRDEEMPVYERLGDVRGKAVTMGKIADILVARGELDEGLRILHEDGLPVYERLGALREKAVTMDKVANILVKRGQLDEGVQILREETLPVYERLGDVRSKAVTMGKIADILVARGDLEEGLRIRRDEVLPVYERLGGRDLMVGLANVASLLIRRGNEADLKEARRYLERASTMAEQMRVPFPKVLSDWLASSAGKG